ncbi:threonine/homoserine/homoserine lactone efflux protein [Vreelandella songnenensis]|uniref:Threonine/homoserine/homoserine lactone efflux protein n=1 Tax=Vreelandella songnenensis TaxID=1176243 RepID=A0A2T0V1F1_9GAMM|nr:LysE family translocator [Halomonas songnenensis]PRY64009.1 threonine/homoserine/homoserine lactone efflux protein [Halomonas songnenensis]
MSASLLLSMSAFALAASISPGPVNLVCLSSGTHYSLAKGLIFVTGATLGFVALFLGIGAGLYSLLESLPLLEKLLRWGGVVFLLYLSVKLARDNGRLSQQASLKAPSFMTGALMQWLNPKAWIASASGISAYTSGSDLTLIAVFALLYLPICWLSLASWVVAGAFLKHHVQKPWLLVSINRLLAALLAISCVYLLLD